MTTAHRPTWKAAVGRSDEGGWTAGGAVSTQRSALDAPAHTSLKFRQDIAVNKQREELKKSLLELEKAESSALSAIHKNQRIINPQVEARGQQRLLKQTADVDDVALKNKYDDSDDDDDGGGGVESESDLDADDSSEDDDSSDDEDDEAALQAELAKIRAERDEKKRLEEEKVAAAEAEQQQEAALIGNPLLNQNQNNNNNNCGGAPTIKRRWNDDVVFRNQAKWEPKVKKRFINDTIRNDFHKRFLDKFMR